MMMQGDSSNTDYDFSFPQLNEHDRVWCRRLKMRGPLMENSAANLVLPKLTAEGADAAALLLLQSE